MQSASTPRLSRRGLILAAIVALLFWGVSDLYGVRRVDIRVFDPNEVARLDNAMWRAYYDRKPLPLYFELSELMREQFHFPYLRSHVVAARGARAAFVFKRGHNRADYEQALPDLFRYFHAIRAISVTPFDDQRAARLELEWWIVHRQRAQHADGDLERALAYAAAALYGVPADSLGGYARDRARAMVLRDTAAAARGVTEAEWGQIEGLLRSSWRSLRDALRPPAVHDLAGFVR